MIDPRGTGAAGFHGELVISCVGRLQNRRKVFYKAGRIEVGKLRTLCEEKVKT